MDVNPFGLFVSLNGGPILVGVGSTYTAIWPT